MSECLETLNKHGGHLDLSERACGEKFRRLLCGLNTHLLGLGKIGQFMWDH